MVRLGSDENTQPLHHVASKEKSCDDKVYFALSSLVSSATQQEGIPQYVACPLAAQTSSISCHGD